MTEMLYLVNRTSLVMVTIDAATHLLFRKIPIGLIFHI